MLTHRRLKLDFESTLCLDRGMPALAQLVLQLAHVGTKLDKFLFLPFLHRRVAFPRLSWLPSKHEAHPVPPAALPVSQCCVHHRLSAPAGSQLESPPGPGAQESAWIISRVQPWMIQGPK